MLWKLMNYAARRKALDISAENGKLFQVLTEHDAVFKPKEYVYFFQSLYEAFDPNNSTDWFSFEFHGTAKGIGCYTWLSGDISKHFLQSNVNAVHQFAELSDVLPRDDYTHPKRFQGKSVVCATLELEEFPLFNLVHSDKEKSSVDLMSGLASSLSNLEENEECIVQYLIRPGESYKLSQLQSLYDLYHNKGIKRSRFHEPYAFLNAYLEGPMALLAGLRYGFAENNKEVHFEQETMTQIKKKVEQSVLYDLTIRIVSASETSQKASERLRTIISSFSPSSDKNRLISYVDPNIEEFLAQVHQRKIYAYPVDNLVSPSELSNLLHYPSSDIPNVLRLKSKKLPVPLDVLQTDTIQEAWNKGAVILGKTNVRGIQKYICVDDPVKFMRHTYSIGTIGSGKTNLLLTLAVQLAREHGIFIADTKDGETIRDFIQHLPKSEWKRIVYIDLSDDEFYMPFNLLKQENFDEYDLTNMICDIFMSSFSDGSILEASADLLFKTVFAVLVGDKNGSLLECYRLLTDQSYLETMVDNLRDTGYADVYQFWEEYLYMKPKERMTYSKALKNKLAKFVQHKRPRFTTCQQDNHLSNMRKLMDEKRILLLNMPLGKVGNDMMKFFASLFMNLISQATLSRQDVRIEHRPYFFTFLDEFELFAPQEAQIRRLLELARSLRNGFILSHQSTKQINSNFLGMVRDNTNIQLSLTLGPDSAKDIQQLFSKVVSEDLVGLENHQGYSIIKENSPEAFTLSTIYLSDMFAPAPYEDIVAFITNYKRMHYRRLSQIKKEINDRYLFAEECSIHEETKLEEKLGNNSKPKGNASGKIVRIS